MRLHRWLVEGRFALGIGSLEPHYFAGVTGAHKTLTIGVMSLRDIEANHAGAMSAAAGPFRLRGNPVFDEIAVQLHRLEGQGLRLFAVNLIPSRGRTARCTAGRPLDALRAGLPELRRVAWHRVSQRVDLVVARVNPPLHRSFYQADKGIKNVEDAVKDGGVILLDAPCPDGVGIDRFLRLLERSPDHAAAVALVRREGYSLGDHKAVRLRRLTDRRRVRIGIVSRDLPEEAVRVLHARRFETRAEAARWATGALGSGRRGVPLKGLLVEDAGNRVITMRSLPSGSPRERIGGSRSRTEG